MKTFGGGGGGGDGGRKANRSLIWLAWLLATAGFGVLLGGIASVQQACGGNPAFNTANVGYLAPVSCDHFLQYSWWITFLHFFAWLLVLIYLASGVLHKSRIALVGTLAIAAVLLMDTANSFLMYNYIPGLSGTLSSRTRTLVAGAIISAAADMLLILLIGWDADRGSERVAGTGTTPVSSTAGPPAGAATTTTTTYTGPVHAVPVSTAV